MEGSFVVVSQQGLHDLPLVHGEHSAADLLIGFVSLAAKDDDVARSGLFHGQRDGRPSIRFYYTLFPRGGSLYILHMEFNP